VSLGENARFVLDEQEGGLVLALAQGVLLSRISEGADGGSRLILTVLTPYGLTRLGGGAQDVEVAVAGSGGRVDVKLGEIELVGKDGKALAVHSGERIEAAAGKLELISRTPGEVSTLEPIVVTVRGAGVEVKPKGAARWRKVPARGEPIEAGATVRTGRATGHLLLGGAHSSLELGPSTEVLVAQTGKAGYREESKIELRRGKLVQIARAGAETSIELPEMTVVGDVRGDRYELQRTGKDLELRAVAGDLKVKREGKEQPLPAGTQVSVKKDALAQSVLEPATLRLTARNGQRVFHPGISEVTLSWSGADTADYNVEVAEDAKFEQLLVEGPVHSSSVTVPAPRKGALFWRVKGASGDESRGSAQFAPEPLSNDLQRARNEVPDGAEKTTIFFQDKPPAVTFLFSPVENAAKYKIAVFRVTELHTPVVERETSETHLRLDEGALAEGSYVWSMTPFSASGETLPTRGRMNKLEMVYDNAVPLLVVLSPRNGEAGKGKLEARGIAPLGSRVYINGKPAPLDEKGRFNTTAFPQGSPPVIIFRLSRPGEPDSVTVRSLR
jgi:hypothetical protein